MNDLNVLVSSPLMEKLVDGTTEKLEKESEIMPDKIREEEFGRLFVLADGIYPHYSRFVRGYKEPISEAQKRLTAWQEANLKRKDLEKGIGVLKWRWQFMGRPITQMKVEDISLRSYCCLALHNMLVTERIIGDCRERYQTHRAIELEDDDSIDDDSVVTMPHLVQEDANVLFTTAARRLRYEDLKDYAENERLMTALVNTFERDN